jgi:hypothetical protein
MQDASDALNAMTKEWQADGLHLWAETEGLLLPQPGQIQYQLGIGSPDAAGVLVNQTALANTVNSGVTLPVISLGTAAAGDTIGVQNSAGAFSIGTVASVSASAGSITMVAPGLSVSALTGAAVFTWHPANQLVRPLRILSLRRVNLISGIRVPLLPYARLDFMSLPNSTQPGTINTWFYDPQLVFGLLNLWQPPASPVQDILTFTFMRPIDDWSTSANIGDFPAEWLSTLAFNLAVEIGPEYDCPPQKMQMLKALAMEKKETAQGFDKESESISFSAATEYGAWR